MARHGATLTLVPHALAEALRVSLSLDPRSAGQTLAQRELVGSIQTALDARRQRIVLSGSSVNAVKWGALPGAGRALPADHRDGPLRQPSREPNHPDHVCDRGGSGRAADCSA